MFTNDPKLKRILESLRDWGRDCFCPPGHDNTCRRRYDWQLGDLPRGYDHKYTYSHVGYNLKITDMQAAVGLAQLERLPDFVAARRKNFETLRNLLDDLKDDLVLPEATPKSSPSWFGFPITLKGRCRGRRTEILRYLEARRIGTRLLFGGNLVRQPYFRNQVYRIEGELIKTDEVMNETFWVGIFPALMDEMLTFTAESIRGFLGTMN